MANAKRSKRWRRGLIIPEPDFILGPGDVLINLTVPPTWSLADLVREIGGELGLPVDPLPPQLENMKSSRSYTVFGSAAKKLDEITAQYEDLCWSIRDGVLQFSSITPPSSLKQTELARFVEVAGRLWADAPRLVNGRLIDASPETIAVELDRHAFPLLDHLEGIWRDKLATWNKAHPRKPIVTWSEALKSKHIRRGVQRTLSRAAEKYNRRKN